MASYSHGEEAAELYEGIPAPMNARGIVTQGSVSQQLLGQQRAGNPVHGVAVPPIFSMYHQLPEELRRSFGVAEGFDLDGNKKEEHSKTTCSFSNESRSEAPYRNNF